jgi:putative tryptophan/tyrosine transport system substrate-binding protein
MRRRDFIAAIGGAATTWPYSARAQQAERARRVGVLLGGAGTPEEQHLYAVFLRQLGELGWKPERNLRVELRWGRGSAEQLHANAAELLSWQPDIFYAQTNLAVAELKPIAAGVPIVFGQVGDPVGSGFVASLAHPGGNITGFESVAPAMGSKWLEVLKQTVPGLTHVLALYHPETPVHRAFLNSIQEAAPAFRLDVSAAGVHDAAEILNAISSFATRPNAGIISLPHAITLANNDLIVALELRHRLPSIHPGAPGSLVRYVGDAEDEMRRAAGYVDRILRGAKAADLPVQAPTKFLLSVNLKVARAIGVEVPSSVLLRADGIIE